MDRIQRRSTLPALAPSGSPPPVPTKKASPEAPPPLERGRSSLAGKLSILASLPRTPLIPTSRPGLPPGATLPLALGSSVGAASASSLDRAAERERSFALVETLHRAGFPGMAHLRDALPIPTKLIEKFPQEGVNGSYDDRRKEMTITSRAHSQIMALSPGNADSFSMASAAVGTLYHETIHHHQDRFIGAAWRSALEKHYEALIDQARAEGRYTPRGASASLAGRYASEAFAKYAGSRAETWMVTKASLINQIKYISDPAELKAALQAQKEGYERGVQHAGKSFGYINEFPSPWEGNFQLPSGPERAKIDEATGIPGGFDKAFPDAARLLASLEEKKP